MVHDLEEARKNNGSSLTVYFTKESHIHTLVNLVLLSGLPIANRRIPELDYAVSSGSALEIPLSHAICHGISPTSHLSFMSEIMGEERQTRSIPYVFQLARGRIPPTS